MSVIFGIHEVDRIIIVADNRTTNKDGEIVSDDSKKLYQIHSGLCIAMAGHRLLAKRVNDNIKKYIVDTQKILTTNDLSVIITQFFDKLNPIEKDIFPLSFSCAYGGINNKNKANLIFGSYNNNNKKYEYKEVTHYDIFSPTDANAKHCYGTLMLNCVQMKKDYPEIILHDIATKSKLVSSCGDMWVFDIPTQKGALTKIQGKDKGEC